MLPLGIGAICILTSIVGTYFVKLGPDNGIMRALYKGLIVTGALSVVGIAIIIAWFIGFSTPLPLTSGGTVTGGALFICALVGLAVTGAIVWITEYYTSTEYRPVRSHRAKLHHRPRHQRDPGPGRLDGGDRAAGDRHLHRHRRRPT